MAIICFDLIKYSNFPSSPSSKATKKTHSFQLPQSSPKSKETHECVISLPNFPTIISKNTNDMAANCIAIPSLLTVSALSIDHRIAKISFKKIREIIINYQSIYYIYNLLQHLQPLVTEQNPHSFSTSAVHPIFLDHSIGSNNTSNSIFSDIIQTSIHAKNTSNVTHNFSNWSDSSPVITKFLKIDTIPRNFSKQ